MRLVARQGAGWSALVSATQADERSEEAGVEDANAAAKAGRSR